jgi:hypothetical protein
MNIRPVGEIELGPELSRYRVQGTSDLRRLACSTTTDLSVAATSTRSLPITRNREISPRFGFEPIRAGKMACISSPGSSRGYERSRSFSRRACRRSSRLSGTFMSSP